MNSTAIGWKVSDKGILFFGNREYQVTLKSRYGNGAICGYSIPSKKELERVITELNRSYLTEVEEPFSIRADLGKFKIRPLLGNHISSKQLAAGRKMLLELLKDRRPSFEKCKTLEDAMNLQEQIATITKLVWEGDYTGGAMLPAEIGKFKNLTLLSLCFTAEITELPKELANCQALEMLFISSRHLQQIPRTIGELKVLKKLELVDCDLREVPSELGTCRALEELTISGNRNLEALPEEIGQLACLNKLNAMGNNLSKVPNQLTKLTSLCTLHLNGNRLVELPQGFGKLQLLTFLDLRGNSVESLPPDLGTCTSLTYIDLGGNKIPGETVSRLKSQLPKAEIRKNY